MSLITPDMTLPLRNHVREFFVSRIRSGIYLIDIGGIIVKVGTPTIVDNLYIEHEYARAYEQAYDFGVLTNEEMMTWMKLNGIWSDEKDDKIKSLSKDIENLKCELFNNFFEPTKREAIRKGIRRAEQVKLEIESVRTKFFNDTAETFAVRMKMIETIRRSVLSDVDVEDLDYEKMVTGYHEQILTEPYVRDIAKNEPWRSLWLMREAGIPLFAEHKRDTTVDQKNILVWSRMYDNIQESMDCPSDSIINDDDALDGWIIVQSRKREKERAEADVKGKVNEKISNADEVMIPAYSKEKRQQIESLNSVHSTQVKKQRAELIKKKGSVTQNEFADERIKLNQRTNEAYKGQFRRK